MKNLALEVKGTPTFEHNMEFHEDIKMDNTHWDMSVTGTYKTALGRQTGECVLLAEDIRKARVSTPPQTIILGSVTEKAVSR